MKMLCWKFTKSNIILLIGALLFFGVPNIRIDQRTIHFRVDVFHGDLETVEESCFSNGDFLTESFHQVFINDTVGGRKKG